jgi:DNA ligase (NAD+)
MKVAKKLLDRLAQFKSFPLETILCAMGIEGLGSVTSKAVARKLKNLEVVLEAQPGKFMEIDGIGEKQARSIFAGLQKMRDWLEPFQEYIGTQEVLQSGPFEGKSFLFTGSLEKFTRQEAENRVESLGGFVASSVSKNLDYLVVGENAGSKMKKAEKFVKEGKLKILDQNSWLQMMDQEAL